MLESKNRYGRLLHGEMVGAQDKNTVVLYMKINTTKPFRSLSDLVGHHIDLLDKELSDI